MDNGVAYLWVLHRILLVGSFMPGLINRYSRLNVYYDIPGTGTFDCSSAISQLESDMVRDTYFNPRNSEDIDETTKSEPYPSVRHYSLQPYQALLSILDEQICRSLFFTHGIIAQSSRL